MRNDYVILGFTLLAVALGVPASGQEVSGPELLVPGPVFTEGMGSVEPSALLGPAAQGTSTQALSIPTLSPPVETPLAAESSMVDVELDEDRDHPWSWAPWDGFGAGLRDGFEEFPRPIGAPLYFEDPFINTDLRPVLLYHEFPRGSLLAGGDLVVLASQARLALTERLQFTATADGVADLEPAVLGGALSGEGWNDLAAGLKYAFYVDKEEQRIASAGVRWRLSNGSRDVFQGREDEISVYLTAASKYDNWHFITDVVGRITTHHGRGNDILSWDLNASYELFENFFPLVEYHGLLYLSNGSGSKGANAALGTKLRDGLLDYGNLGSADVRGSSAHWATAGLRWNFKPGVSYGAGYGYGLRSEGKNDILKRRFTMNLIFTF